MVSRAWPSRSARHRRPGTPLIREVVRINALQLVGGIGPHPDAMVDHELRELLSVDQNHLGLDTAGELRGAEVNEDVVMKTPFRVRFPCRAPTNFWDLRPTVLAHRLAWI